MARGQETQYDLNRVVDRGSYLARAVNEAVRGHIPGEDVDLHSAYDVSGFLSTNQRDRIRHSHGGDETCEHCQNETKGPPHPITYEVVAPRRV